MKPFCNMRKETSLMSNQGIKEVNSVMEQEDHENLALSEEESIDSQRGKLQVVLKERSNSSSLKRLWNSRSTKKLENKLSRL